MQGVLRGLCLLAFLLSVGQADELEGVKKDLDDPKDVQNLKEMKENEYSKESSESETADDLKGEVSLAVTESNSQDNEERSGAIAHSTSHGFGGSSLSKAYAYGGGDGIGYAAQSKAVTGYAPQVLPLSPMNPELTPYMPTSLSQVEAQAINDGGSSYGQGMSSYPYSPSYPYSSGSSSAQGQAEADNGFYQPTPIVTPVLNPYSQASSPAQPQAQANDGLYQPILTPNPQGLSFPQTDNESHQSIVEPMLPKTVSRYSQDPDLLHVYPSSYPYSLGSSAGKTQADGELYQPIIRTNDPMVKPYGQGFPQGISLSDAYQTIPIPDPNQQPYEPYLTPYKASSSAMAQAESEYQPIPVPNLIPKLRSNFPQIKPQLGNEAYPYQPLPIVDPNPAPYDPYLVPYRGSSSAKAQADNEPYQPIPIPYDPKTYIPYASSYAYNSARSGPALEDPELSLRSKNAWDTFVYKPYPQNGPNPQLYPPGTNAGQPYYADVSSPQGPGGVINSYIPPINSYTNDYPSESPYRPRGLTPVQSDPWLPNASYGNGEQSPPIAFEDAKSRLIYPREYIFPNKMPGGDNVVQCTKENEFHHFWAQEVSCLVCICVNEYGLLTPVCASCGGCQNPPPKYPIQVPRFPDISPVRPTVSEPPFGPIPEPYRPEPEPTPEGFEPIPRPNPVPEPNEPRPPPYPAPPYPEPEPSFSPKPFQPPPIPTLPPPPPEDTTCNPLPSGQPFTNPLHPCQICICRESYMSGKPDVQIQCKENPQCIAPADVTTLPPIPDVPMPIPLPLCEKFPEHVLFPHPTDTCKLCKCSNGLSDAGVNEQQITCYPHPDCIPKLEPITEPPGLLPPPLPIPIEPHKMKPYPGPEPVEPLRGPFQPLKPVPLPEIVTAEPLLWPPMTTTTVPVSTPSPNPMLTPRPGPLPGPSPHESCRPYPPNQAFQHPWDECQLCICTEAFATGMVTVEVNCYTKPICCIEPPDAVKPGYTAPYPGISNGATGPDILPLPNPSQPNGLVTSTYRPALYSPYSPRPVNIYPNGNQPPDTLGPSQGYPGPYTRLQPDEAYANPPPNYPYQPSYRPGYEYPVQEYPVRLGGVNGPYKQSNYGYPVNQQYNQGDAIGNVYPGPKGAYQPYESYEPRYQGVPGPGVYPSKYQRPNYEMPPMYSTAPLRDGYAQAQASAQGGPDLGVQSAAQSYAGERLRPKNGNDAQEDSDESR